MSLIEDLYGFFEMMNSQATDKAMVLQSQIVNLETPSDLVLVAYRDWLNGPGKSDQLLRDRSQRMLDHKQDLASLKTLSDSDPLSRFLRSRGPSLLYVSLRIHIKASQTDDK